MKKSFIKLLVLMCIAVCTALVFPLVTSAASSGTCGDNLTWTLDEGTLTISGTGDMWSYYGFDGSRAPWYNLEVNSIVIDNVVTSIGNWAFSGCGGLTSVTIGNSVESIGNWAFWGCNSLTSVSIPDSVTSISSSAFSGCSSMTSVTIGNSVESIGYHAFYECSNLTSVTIGNSVESIGGYAFSGCTGLTSVTTGNSVTSIGDSAFRGCSNMKSVSIGQGVETIGDYAFAECTSLTEVTYRGSEEEWDSILIHGGNNVLHNNVVFLNEPDVAVDNSSCGYDGESVIAKVVFDYTTKDCTVYLAVYDGYGKLVNAGAAAAPKGVRSAEITIPADVSYIGCKYKIMIWKSDSMIPYGSAINGTVQSIG